MSLVSSVTKDNKRCMGISRIHRSLGSIRLCLEYTSAMIPAPSLDAHTNGVPAKQALAGAQSQFPPVLMQPDAPTWTVPKADVLLRTVFGDPQSGLTDDPMARLVRASEAAIRVPGDAAFHAAVSSVQRDIAHVAAHSGCAWQGILSLQSAFLQEHRGLHAPTHAADQPEDSQCSMPLPVSVEILRIRYLAMHDRACVDASLYMSTAANVWCQEANHATAPERTQRYLFNLLTDFSIVQRDGTVGRTCTPENFVSLGEIDPPLPDNGEVGFLQGQGPVTVEAKSRYFEAAFQYATRRQIQHIVFVNAAEGDAQIPSFASDLNEAAASMFLPVSYVGSIQWADGSLTTPLGAAMFAKRVVQRVQANPLPAMVVANCNAGLDRSGITNVLVRAIGFIDAAHAQQHPWSTVLAQTFDQVPTWVARLKRVRPHAISSWGRYLFIYQAINAYAVHQQHAAAPEVA